ncbi:MAG: hypothetical protein A2648_01325 [Candidatus Lloydbacteria bacterium RIFCSPHIGHO2_01_FULL_41_20]|uniref:DUF2269 domain-containing protein n=1 Tax=Candidatus Lloydbacteria bacterium RIFCSPHIGHO2_01_FULL_41_20 TaxID=1798657 RepID=A0A1G2CS40_9BACT|nr:MAG: hypothetical protein A2648_01325 [Candidatus Lloydbacteria bacterium RIFCSPHIGHO2_01_FULL_41_20]
MYQILVIAHIIGTVLGVGGATFAEIFHIRAMRDGVVTDEESVTLKIFYTVLRVGLVLLVLSGFAFLIYFRLEGHEKYLYNPKLWAKMIIVFIIPINAILFQIKKIPAWLATPISLTSWYTALILGVYRTIPYSFVEIMGIYLASILVIALVLWRIKDHYSLSRIKS